MSVLRPSRASITRVSRRVLPLLACALFVPGSAAAQDSRHLWATVNICDTISHPDTIGIRGSMPGTGNADERMFMRVQVQYFDRSSQLWHNIPKDGDSGWVSVGSARFKARQAGATFIFAPPSGGSWLMRGAVKFQWRLHGRVRRHVKLLTTAGHRSAAGADPPGSSSDTCVIS